MKNSPAAKHSEKLLREWRKVSLGEIRVCLPTIYEHEWRKGLPSLDNLFVTDNCIKYQHCNAITTDMQLIIWHWNKIWTPLFLEESAQSNSHQIPVSAMLAWKSNALPVVNWSFIADVPCTCSFTNETAGQVIFLLINHLVCKGRQFLISSALLKYVSPQGSSWWSRKLH